MVYKARVHIHEGRLASRGHRTMYSVANLWSTHDFLNLDKRYDGLRPLLRDLALRLNEAIEPGIFDLLTGVGSTGGVYKILKVITNVHTGRLAGPPHHRFR